MSEYEKLSLVELRVEARKLGIKSVTSYKKQELLDKVHEVVDSGSVPVQTTEKVSKEQDAATKPSSRGRKPAGRKRADRGSKESADASETVPQGENAETGTTSQEAVGTVEQNRTEPEAEQSASHKQESKTAPRKRKESDSRTSSYKREGDGRTGAYKRENDNRAGGYKRDNDARMGNYKREHDAKTGTYKKTPRQSYQNQSHQNQIHQNVTYQNPSTARNYTTSQGEHTPSAPAQGRSVQNQNTQSDRFVQQGQKRIQDLSPAEIEQQDSGIEREGILEVLSEGYGFIRCDNFLPGERDIYVAPAIIRKYHLRTGDILSGNLRIKSQNEKFGALLYLKSVNGCTPESVMDRIKFEKLTPVFPNERIRLETPGSQISMRMMDLISPIGKGQRGMIVSQPKTGKTTLLKQVAKAVKTNHPKMHLIVLLIDERPEEVTDIKESIMGHNVDVIYSTFDELPENHKRVSENGQSVWWNMVKML